MFEIKNTFYSCLQGNKYCEGFVNIEGCFLWFLSWYVSLFVKFVVIGGQGNDNIDIWGVFNLFVFQMKYFQPDGAFLY